MSIPCEECILLPICISKISFDPINPKLQTTTPFGYAMTWSKWHNKCHYFTNSLTGLATVNTEYQTFKKFLMVKKGIEQNDCNS